MEPLLPDRLCAWHQGRRYSEECDDTVSGERVQEGELGLSELGLTVLALSYPHGEGGLCPLHQPVRTVRGEKDQGNS